MREIEKTKGNWNQQGKDNKNTSALKISWNTIFQ